MQIEYANLNLNLMQIEKMICLYVWKIKVAINTSITMVTK